MALDSSGSSSEMEIAGDPEVYSVELPPPDVQSLKSVLVLGMQSKVLM